MSYYFEFGELLNQSLLRLDRSPAWLAQRLGINRSAVSRWLNEGARPGNPEMVVRIADLLGMASQREQLLAAAGYGYVKASVAAPVRLGGSEQASDRLPNALPDALSDSWSHAAIPFVGREAEWEALQQSWQAVGRRNPQLVAVWGEAGMGKTRLVEELARWVRLRGSVVAHTRSYEAEGAMAYTPLTEWLRTPALQQALVKLDDLWLTELARLLPELLIARPALPKPTPMAEGWQRQRFHEALARAIFCAPQPLLLILDDLQWVDGETVGWLRYLLRFDPQTPLLIVATVRTEAVSAGHPLLEQIRQLQRAGHYRALELAALSVEETAVLAGHLSDEDVRPWAEQLYAETEGNPLFVVETMRAGLLGHLQEGRAGQPLVPTVQVVISARLEQLSAAAQQLAQVAATIGRDFSFQLLAAASESSEEALTPALDELWQRRIVREQRAGYDFSHDKIREVAYRALTPARRRLLHRKVALALQGLYAQRLPEIAGELAMHFEAGGWLDESRHYYEQAGDYAVDRYANQSALAALGQALALTSETEPLARFRILALLRKVHARMGENAAELEDLATMQALAESLPLDVAGQRARGQIANFYSDYKKMHGDQEGAIVAAQRAILHAKAAGAIDLEAFAYSNWGWARWVQAQYAEARGLFLQTLELARRAGLQALLADTLGNIAASGVFSGLDLYEQTLTYLNEALAIFRQMGHRWGESLILNRIAFLVPAHGEGGFAGAEKQLLEALEIGKSIGDPSKEALTAANLTVLYTYFGDYRRALAYIQRSQEVAPMVPEPRQRGANLIYAGATYMNIGDLARAQKLLEEGHRLLHDNGVRIWEVMALNDLGFLHILRGEYERAIELLDELLAMVRVFGERRLEGWALTRRGQALLALGREEEAFDSFQAGLVRHQEMEQGNRALVAMAGLATILLRRGEIQAARAYLDQICGRLASHEQEVTEEVLLLYLRCVELLAALGDGRSEWMRGLARAQVQRRAASLDDPELLEHFWARASHQGL